MSLVRAEQLGPAFRGKKSFAWHAWTFIRSKPLGALGGISLVLFVITAFFAPLIATHDQLAQDIPNRLHAPSVQFLFGTDHLGRDQFSRVAYGARISMYVGLLSVIIGTVTGTATGIASAYAGGRFDLLVQRFIDALQGIPSLVLVMALVVALGPSLNNVTIAIAIAFFPRMTRIARSQALTVKGVDYVLAARALGASPFRIALRHVTLNSLTPVIVLATGFLGNAIVTEAGLSFLGIGVPPPHPSWGRMLQLGVRGYQEAAPWLTIFPGLALTITVFGFNLFGDALRDSLDPRLRGK
jgi:peptide/nickel transport system permease protein